MSAAVTTRSSSPGVENTPPAENVAPKPRRFFRSHNKKKATNNPPDDDVASSKSDQTHHSVDMGGKKLLRRSSSVGQMSLRVAPFLKNLRAIRNQHLAAEQPIQHSVRFDLTRNRNHCYEDEHYMRNNPQWSSRAMHASEYDQYMSGGGPVRGQSSEEYYSQVGDTAAAQVHCSEPPIPPARGQSKAAPLDQGSQEPCEKIARSDIGRCADLVEADPDCSNMSTVTDDVSNDCATFTISALSTSGELSSVCDCSTAVDDSNRQPLAVKDMAQKTTTTDGSCMSMQSREVSVPSYASSTKRRNTLGDSDDENSEAAKTSPAKRVFIKTVTEHPVEVQQRVQHLQAEVNKEEGIERQACQALEVCQSRSSKISDQELEAERLLLLSGTKVGRCQSELKHLQLPLPEGEGDRMGSASSSMFLPPGMRQCVATIQLADICLPLHLGFLASLGRDSVGHFIVVCRAGSDIVSSTKVKGTRDTVNFSSGIVFEDTLTLEGLHLDSQIDIEVYFFSSGKSRDHDISSAPLTSTPTKIRFPGSDSQTFPTPKKGILGFRTSEFTSSPGRSPVILRSGPKTSRFQLIASSVLNMSALRKHTQLKLQEWSSQHIVFGHVFATVTGRVHFEEHSHSGFLTWREEVDGVPNWRRLWCEQVGTVIRAWQYPTDKDTKAPVKVLDLTIYTEERYTLRVDVADPDVSVRKYSLMLTAMPPRKVTKAKSDEDSDLQMHVFSADSRTECGSWVDALQHIVDDLEAWRSVPPFHEA